MSRRNIEIRRLAYSAIMISLSVVLTRFASFYFVGMRIGFGSIPIVFASVICGPFWGMLVGASSDLLGALLFPVGPYFPGYTIDAALQGLIPYLVLKLLKGRNKTQYPVSIAFISVFITMVVCFVSLFSTYKKQEIYDWARIVIPFVFVLYFVVVFTLFYILGTKTKILRRAARDSRRFSLNDLYVAALVDEVIVAMGFLGLWNNIVFNLDFFVSAFSQALLFSVNGLLRTFILYYILNAISVTDMSSVDYGSKFSNKETDKQCNKQQ
jgi:ECF transporter S component (folate family)